MRNRGLYLPIGDDPLTGFYGTDLRLVPDWQKRLHSESITLLGIEYGVVAAEYRAPLD
jgi:hypothetical protein